MNEYILQFQQLDLKLRKIEQLFEDEDKKSQMRICTLGSSRDRVSQLKIELLPVWCCSNAR